MKIIISPAKKMNINTDDMEVKTSPIFLERAIVLMEWIRGMSYEEAKKLWGCNDKIAALNYERFQTMDLKRGLTPALLAYEGIQYQYMAPHVFEYDQWDYVEDHLRILSGFYGILRPLDGVVPYRLEMQAKGRPGRSPDRGPDSSPDSIPDGSLYGRNLYGFWKDDIYQALAADTDCIVNLASKEYSRCIENWLEDGITYVTCVFGEERDGKVIRKGTQAKMARGEMVRYMAERQITDWQAMKSFNRLGYTYSEKFSDEGQLVFLKS